MSEKYGVDLPWHLTQDPDTEPSYEELADRIEELEAENARLREALQLIERATSYPVCTSINPRGYDTSTATKDLVELVAKLSRAALQEGEG